MANPHSAGVTSSIERRRATAPGVMARKARIRELEAENESLRKRLNMTEPTTLTAWESFGTPRVRAEMAARALYQENCNARRAMRLLGFDEEDARDERIQARILKADAVLDILESAFGPPKELKRAVLQHAAQNAVLGNPDVSIRATAQLAKLAGWVKSDPANINVQTLVGLMNPAAAHEKPVHAAAGDDILSILGHEPGEPVRINSGDTAVERAAAQSEGADGI